jgi:hypothetical protein
VAEQETLKPSTSVPAGGVRGDDDQAVEALKDDDPTCDERLDEGVEETFPASDPVSVKHIT